MYKIDSKTLGWVELTKIFNRKLCAFLWAGFKIVLAIYVEWFGFELNTYLAAVTHDQFQISAFVNW
jgi:hypothetical protein